MEVKRCMIVSAAEQVRAQTLCVDLAGPSGDGMFTTGASPTGSLPATHYITEGWIKDRFAALLVDPILLFTTCVLAGLTLTQADCNAILAASDISEEDPFAAMDRLGLVLVQDQTA